jgi:hypothetical protein
MKQSLSLLLVTLISCSISYSLTKLLISFLR